MKVLHVNTEKTWRGGERQTLLLAEALPNADPPVHSTLLCRRGAPLAIKASEADLPLIATGGSGPGAIVQLLRVAPRFDVIHCHTGRGHSLAALASFLRPTPLVVTRRVDFLPRQTAINRFKFARSAKVVCISQFILDQLHRWGVPREKLSVIPSAVPLQSSVTSSKDLVAGTRRTLNVPANKKLVGNIAALVPHKDHATLLRAARFVRDRRSDVHFVIVGEGELRHELHRLRQELALVDSVTFTGFVQGAERLLPAFDVFAMSSCMEGLGSIVLDAFAAGVPVATTAGGGLPELVHDMTTGLLAPVHDSGRLGQAILTLLDDPGLSSQLVANARAFLTRGYSVDRMASAYVSVYREVLSR